MHAFYLQLSVTTCNCRKILCILPTQNKTLVILLVYTPDKVFGIPLTLLSFYILPPPVSPVM